MADSESEQEQEQDSGVEEDNAGNNNTGTSNKRTTSRRESVAVTAEAGAATTDEDALDGAESEGGEESDNDIDKDPNQGICKYQASSAQKISVGRTLDERKFIS